MNKVHVKLQYTVDVEVQSDLFDMEGMVEAVLDEGCSKLFDDQASVRVLETKADEGCESGIAIKLTNEIGMKLGYLKRKERQYIVKYDNEANKFHVQDSILKRDPNCKFDKEGNPSIMWISTILFANEIEQIPDIFCALESRGGKF